MPRQLMVFTLKLYPFHISHFFGMWNESLNLDFSTPIPTKIGWNFCEMWNGNEACATKLFMKSGHRSKLKICAGVIINQEDFGIYCPNLIRRLYTSGKGQLNICPTKNLFSEKILYFLFGWTNIIKNTAGNSYFESMYFEMPDNWNKPLSPWSAAHGYNSQHFANVRTAPIISFKNCFLVIFRWSPWTPNPTDTRRG